MAEANPISRAFGDFFEEWLICQEHHLQQLFHAIEEEINDEERCSDLVNQIITHYAQYFEAKAKVVQENVFLVLTPTWFSSFERAYLWIGGFKPGLAFRLVANNVFDLSDDQARRVDGLTAEIREDEKEIMDEFNRVQERMTVMELARHMGRLRNGAAASDVETAEDRLKVSMEILVECADFLRRKTGLRLLEILRPTQAVRFLAAAAQLQLRLRRWGMQRDVENRRRSAAVVSNDTTT